MKSVFDTTPADILHEIVVVDDGRASVCTASCTSLDTAVCGAFDTARQIRF